MAQPRLTLSIHPFFWLFAALIGWMMASTLTGIFSWVLVILVSVLVHEFGHALTGLSFGQEVAIRLEMFGGVTYRRGPKLKLWQDFLITFNGPLAGFLLAGGAYLLRQWVAKPDSVLAVTLAIFLYVNIFWTIVNLVPILPLDGGQLLRIILERFFGYRATSIALLIGLGLGVLLSILFLVLGLFLLGMIFMILSFESYRGWKAYRIASEHDQNPELQKRYADAMKALENGAPEVALEGLSQIRALTGRGLLYVAVTQQLASLLADRGSRKEAYQLLHELGSQLSPDLLPLYQELAYEEGEFAEVVRIGSEAYQVGRHYSIAFINALAHAALGQVHPAVGWLQCAQRDGMGNLARAIEDPKFDRIRNEGSFQKYRESLQT